MKHMDYIKCFIIFKIENISLQKNIVLLAID